MINKMQKYRQLLKRSTLFVLFLTGAQILSAKKPETPDGEHQRAYLVKTLTQIADPVLENLSKNQLKAKMPVEAQNNTRTQFTHLEAFGRLMAGMAPWLELGADMSEEGKLRKKYIDLAVSSLKNATDPTSADYMNFNKGGQALVDAAFLAQALLRSPTQLWGKLDEESKKHVLYALKSSRVITPSYSNWLLFSAEIEAALLKFGGEGDRMRIDYAIKSHQNWYKGDGTYGDGPNFHWDYYNSFVIQPMLIDVAQTLLQIDKTDYTKRIYNQVIKRAQRYAEIQERLISPEGTYPPIGRSLAYRYGAFQVLSQIAYLDLLPEQLKPQQVRSALYTVIRKQTNAPGTFDANGWLRIGFFGSQPEIGEVYISTGSLYLCSQAFLILGLPPNHAFWQGDDILWTAKKFWQGEKANLDHARN